MDKPGHSCLLVMWSRLVPLLSKCQTAGCASVVSEDNMKRYSDGMKTINSESYSSSIQVLF
jgi:hypothetical protein